MVHKEKIERLKGFKNENEFREFLIDYLKKVGFEQVQHTHQYGNPEYGKDIVAKFQHPLEGDEWYAFVVKKGRISGNSDEIETIKNQIKQAFEYPYVDPVKDKKHINKVKVVTNENLTKGARESIMDSPEMASYGNVSFWWNEPLIDLIDENYPDFWLPGDIFSKDYSKALQKEINEEFELKELNIQSLEDTKVKKLLNIFIKPRIYELERDEKNNDDNAENSKIKRSQISLDKITDDNKNFIITGEAGSGKTKIINKLICDFLDPSHIVDRKILPIKIKGRNLEAKSFSIEEVVNEELKRLAGESYKRLNIDEYHKVIFIDEIDLIDKESFEILHENLETYCSTHNGRYILSERENLSFELTSNDHTRKVKINNFDSKQVESFIKNYFDGNSRGERFIQILRESNLLSKLPTTPLTITLLSLLYDNTDYEVPATLADIYDDFTQVLLGKLRIRGKIELLSYQLRRRIFSILALKMLYEEKYVIEFSEFEEIVNGFLRSRNYPAKSKEDLTHIIQNSGLLYIDHMNSVGFKQQTFVEFLASNEIYHHERINYYSYMLRNFNNVNWQNTAVFFGGISKDLPEIVDHLFYYCQNEGLRDLLVNSGGMGYLAQALYQTKPQERKKLIFRTLDNLIQAFYELKELSREEIPFYKEIPLPFIATVLNFWFSENFKSITLHETLIESFDDIINDNPDSYDIPFEVNLKLFLIASTLMNKYIDDDSRFNSLVERKSFMNDPVLTVAGDMFLDNGDIVKKNVDKNVKKAFQKSLRKKVDFIKSLIKEPAYRFADDYRLIDKHESEN